ncbi:MAG: type II toxin-antitoxin system HicA family toxin [Thermovirgaceae bacterium]|nr:type II toxin-antitoxin system HicA family toxin [Thermovirgaceae bacterium]
MGKQYSQKELIIIAKAKGWDIDETRGKGSHVLAMKPGERPFPIPRKIKPGLLASLKKRLQIDD